jgi:hypothetical protein
VSWWPLRDVFYWITTLVSGGRMKADRVSEHEVDKHSVERAKTEAPKPTPTGVA